MSPVDPEADRKGTFAFIAVLALYAQLLTFGYLLASGVVEEKTSRVVEVLLATDSAFDCTQGGGQRVPHCRAPVWCGNARDALINKSYPSAASGYRGG